MFIMIMNQEEIPKPKREMKNTFSRVTERFEILVWDGGKTKFRTHFIYKAIGGSVKHSNLIKKVDYISKSLGIVLM